MEKENIKVDKENAQKKREYMAGSSELIYEGKRTLGSIFGAFLYAAGINLFVVPANLYTGGLMGICQVIRTLMAEYLHLTFSNMDIAGIIYYLINIPIFILAFTRMGKCFFGKTVVAVTAMSVFLSLIPTVQIVDDVMAASVVGALISGAGVGIILRMGASGGGMDVVGVLLTRWRRDFSVGKVNLLVNLALYGTCLFLFDVQIVVASGGGMDVVGVLLTRWRRDFSVGKVNLLVNLALYGTCLFLFDVQIVVYSLINAAVYSIAMDKVHTQNINVEVNVITKAGTDALEKKVFEELGRGITKWNSVGAYTHEQSQILYIMLSKYEVNRLKAIIHEYDSNAFIVVNEGVSVDGNYLKKL